MQIPIKSMKSFDGCHIFRDTNDDLIKIYFANDKLTAYTKSQILGFDLINFCKTDFSDIENIIKDSEKHRFFQNQKDYVDDYNDLINLFYENLIKYESKCYPAYIFMSNAFNKIVYAYEDDDFEMLNKNISEFKEEINNILLVRDFFITALHICFADGNDTYQERVLKFFTINHGLIDYQFTTVSAFLPTVNGKLNCEKVENSIHNSHGNLYDSYTSANVDFYKANIAECIVANNIFDMYFYELLEIFKQGINLSRCWYCGNFLYRKQKKKTLFCDRINVNGLTCKQVGAKLKFKAEKENDKYLKEYDKIYNRYYTRAERFDYADTNAKRKVMEFSMTDFYDWSLMASMQRKKHMKGEISGDEMIEKIEAL